MKDDNKIIIPEASDITLEEVIQEIGKWFSSESLQQKKEITQHITFHEDTKNMHIYNPILLEYKSLPKLNYKIYESMDIIPKDDPEFINNITEKLLNPEWCYEAGLRLSDNEFDTHAEQLISTLTKDPTCCNLAGRDWSNKRFNPYADKIAQAVIDNPYWSLVSGTNWLGPRFNRYAERLAASVAEDLEQACNGINSDVWPEDRRKHLTEAIKKRYDACPHYKARTEDDIAPLLKLHKGLGIDALSTIPTEQIGMVEEAYAFATQARAEKLFFEGLKTNITRSTIDKYCKAIIQYFRTNAIGAGNYRMLEVAA